VDDPDGCLPLYLRHNDPMSVPILSHNSPTNNVLLKITVPKRIGKRKRGSQEPFSEIVQSNGLDGLTRSSNHSSAHLLRALRDNAGQYEVEAVAEIERTHRFRGTSSRQVSVDFNLTRSLGLADFHHSTTHSEFATKFNDFILPGKGMFLSYPGHPLLFTDLF
jgi:general transcription factor 3C polypeptide 5 (transcription factor C subunit 1)